MLIAQAEQIASLRAEVEELSRRLGQSSANSSRPPSGDPPSVPGRGAGKGSGRKQGGQQGHPGSSRSMVADPDETVDHWPPACGGCGHEFAAGELVGDGSPVAHQVTDVRVLVTVCEHRLRPRALRGLRQEDAGRSAHGRSRRGVLARGGGGGSDLGELSPQPP